MARHVAVSAAILLVLLATAGRAAAGSGYPSSIIAADAPWSFRVGDALDSWVFRFPDDLPRLRAQPATVQARIDAEIERIKGNRAYIRQLGTRFHSDPRARKVEVRPDYVRRFGTAAISISFEDSASDDPLWRHRPIIDALPRDTRLLVRAPAEVAARLKQLGPKALGGREVRFVAGSRERARAGVVAFARPSRWIRDAFVVAASTTTASDSVLLLPPAYFQVDDLKQNDLIPFESAEVTGQASLRLPIFIRAGNLHAAEARSNRLLFVGEREAPFHREAFQYSTGQAPPPSLFADVLAEIAGSARVIELPNSDSLFHIDMVVGFPRPGVAAIIQPLDPAALDSEDLRVIKNVRAILEREGFQILAVPTTAQRIAQFQSPVNFVAYRDRETGQQALILPEFPDLSYQVGGRPQSLNAAIRAAYIGEGLLIKPVEDRFHPRGGNVHCALQALN